ncbi:MAG: DUF4430 domain-containing protein [Candidatus Diapherotrites archaeon]|nr:DUF4430 domain-containing protein [Candidatus Diapherotrites archaeon]
MKKQLSIILVVVFLLAGCTQQVQQQAPQTGSEENISKMTISFVVNDGKENILEKTVEVEKGTTALEALREATVVSGKQYEFGFFIESIAGVDAGQSHYWAIYVDGTYAEKGIDQIALDKDTQIKLVLEEIREF